VQGIPGLNDDRIFGKRQPFSPEDSSDAAASNDSKEGEPPLLLYGLMPVGFEGTACAMSSRLWVVHALTCHGCSLGGGSAVSPKKTRMKVIFFERSLYFRSVTMHGGDKFFALRCPNSYTKLVYLLVTVSTCADLGQESRAAYNRA
jgi:hypothetical protein